MEGRRDVAEWKPPARPESYPPVTWYRNNETQNEVERGGALRFTDDLTRRICAVILARWKAKGLIRPKMPDDALLARMTSEIEKDIQREAELDRDSEALLQKHLGQIESSQANSRLLFQKIKERLAKERDIVL
jgi:hypothetical protein